MRRWAGLACALLALGVGLAACSTDEENGNASSEAVGASPSDRAGQVSTDDADPLSEGSSGSGLGYTGPGNSAGEAAAQQAQDEYDDLVSRYQRFLESCQRGKTVDCSHAEDTLYYIDTFEFPSSGLSPTGPADAAIQRAQEDYDNLVSQYERFVESCERGKTVDCSRAEDTLYYLDTFEFPG